MKNEKKIIFGADLEWATTHLSIGVVSQYNYCIVTQWDGRLAWLKRKKNSKNNNNNNYFLKKSNKIK